MEEILWESTYKNDSLGAFLLGSVSLSAKDEMKFSLNLKDDKVRIQDDTGLDWKRYEHQTLSVGLESHFSLSLKWKFVGGASLDYLKKQAGEDKSSFNPILGIKFNPLDEIDVHATLSKKLRFPSMKSLYATNFANPDLREERGTSYELGFRYERAFLFNRLGAKS